MPKGPPIFSLLKLAFSLSRIFLIFLTILKIFYSWAESTKMLTIRNINNYVFSYSIIVLLEFSENLVFSILLEPDFN